MKAFVLVCYALTCLTIFDANATDWPRWRGQNMDNKSPEAGELNPWPDAGPQELWRSRVGVGFSSLAVSHGRLYTLGNGNNIDTIYCLNSATGSVIWTNAYPASLAPILYEGGPSATPTVQDGVVYTLGKAGDLFCLNATNGAVVWRKRLIQDLGLAAAEWGFASSPLIIGEKLLLNVGGFGCALNKETGDLIWLSSTNKAGYSTLVPFDADGTNALLIFAYRTLAAVTLETGKLLWSIPWQTHYDMNCSDPIPYKGRYFVSSYTHAATMLEFRNSQLRTNWQNSQLSVHLSPGVVISNYIYAFHGDAELANTLKCIDLDTGLQKWSAPAMPVGAIISVANRLVILTGNGELILAEANPTAYVPLARKYVLSGRCWTMPVFVDGTLYARSAAGDLIALALPFIPAVDPTLQINTAPFQRVVLSWPQPANGFQLQRRLLDQGASWHDITDPPAVNANRYILTNQAIGGGSFYRLIKP